MSARPTRRDLMKSAAMLGLAGNAAAAQGGLPSGKIGPLTISRLVLGGNMLGRVNHSRDLAYVTPLVRHYNTDEKLLETLALAETHGIDTLATHPDPQTLAVLKRHRARGGKIKWILSTEPPVHAAPAENMEAHRQRVAELVDHGTDAMYLWGVRTDSLVKAGQIDLVARAMEIMKATKLPVGIGAHTLAGVTACEKAAIESDFYVKTLHHHDYPTAPKPGEAADDWREIPGYWCGKPHETVEFMRTVKKPWFAFKVMAVGAIPPKSAFRYAFENGADFVIAGMFDFEIEEDVQIARDVLAGVADRTRPWRA